MKPLICCIAAALALLGTSPASAALHVIDLMPAFWSVWDTPLTPAQRVAAFKKQIINVNPDVYANDEFHDDLRSDEAVSRYLEGLARSVPAMRLLSDQLVREVPLVEAAFAKALPDFDSRNLLVVFLPSFHHFNAQTRDFGDRGGVFFGVDGIVDDEGASPHIGVDVAHELFHIYQQQMHPQMSTDDFPLWQQMWNEGSAAYASQRLIPGATKVQALGAELASARADQIKILACGIQRRWTSKKHVYRGAYFRSDQHVDGAPSRGGYVIGYLLAQDLGKTLTLAQIGKVGTEIEPQLAAGVEKLCRQGTL